MADSIISIASTVAECLVAPIGRQLGYLSNYHSNLDDLKIQLDKLKVVKIEVKQDVDNSMRNVEVIRPSVVQWLESVNGITEEAEEILQEDEDKAKKRCLNGLCPNLKSRYQLSKKAKKMAEEVVKIKNGGNFERVSDPLAPQETIVSAPTKDYEDFESRRSTLEEIMEAVRNPNINMIGVDGMGGVGKTMLVKEAARKAKEEKLFDEVVMAVVKQTPNIRNIQKEIAYPLGLRFNDQEINDERKDRLCRRLKQEKSILIILDDVWAQLDLEEIGIPSGDIHKGCKIVVTSRRLLRFSNQMNIEHKFGIGPLLEEEAWNLFKKMAGDCVEDSQIKPTAPKVAKECAGLPIAIAVVATALKTLSPPVWKDALRQLQTAETSIEASIEGMNAKVYSSLKLSYDFLESEAQKLFLLCSLLPEDYQFSIQELLYYGKGVGLFQGIPALETARDRVHALVNQLKASCLLLDGDTSGFFKMHDVLRDVGISVASKDKQMLLVRNEVELEEWKAEEKLRFCSALSLPHTDIHALPTGLESPQLKFFLFFSSLDDYSEIPDSFFGGMKQLKVLTLGNMYFSSLPSSLLFLSSLQTLCLVRCTLPNISIIGELKTLEILSFGHCNIEELPGEIGQLTLLKLLDLRDCSALKVIRPKVMARLSQLEELYMPNCFDRWGVDGNASLAELQHFSRLVTLEVYIQADPNILPNDLVFENLTRYRIYIGDFEDWSGDYEISRTLKLKVNTSIHLLSGINKLLKRTEDLHLEELNGFRSILNDSVGEGFHDTRCLHVGSSSEIEYVIDTSVPFSAFPKLESLLLKKLFNLKEICHGQLTAESFCHLRKVKVIDCDRLQNLFPLYVARRLSKLQEIEISYCKNMDGIVAEGREAAEDNNGAVFPQLRSLTLDDLPELVSFCSKVKAVVPCTSDAGSKEIISSSEGEHGISIPLFNEKDTFPNLEKLHIESISMKEIWHSQLPDGSFCNLRKVEVIHCNGLQNLFPLSVARRLSKLQEIEIWNCSNMDGIVAKGREAAEDNNGAVYKNMFPQLRSLTLSLLPMIISIPKGKHDISIPLFNEKVAFPNLEKLDLRKLKSAMAVWMKDSQGSLNFQKLSSLYIGKCTRLINVFTTSMVQFQDMVEESNEKEAEAIDKIIFPQVKSLTLEDLDQFVSFCEWIHISEWPSLKKLKMSECYNVEIFASELSTFKETRGKQANLGTPTKQPLFLVDKVAFPNLEEMELYDMYGMKVIWQGQFHAQSSFCKLRVLTVSKCNNILKVFPSSLLRNLQNLEELYVKDCCSLEDVFELEGGVGETEQFHAQSSFRKLRVMRVEYCIKIFKVFPSSLLRNLQNLEELYVKDCWSLEDVFELEGGVGETEQFHAQSSFRKLRVMRVENCGKILKVFPSSLLRNLQNLEELSIENCRSLVDVFEHEGGVRETEHASTFPLLKELRLIRLPELMHLWKEDSQLSAVFQNLKTLEVRSCGSLTCVFPSTRAEGPMQIECTTVAGDRGEATDETTFSQLYYLELRDLPNLTSFCIGDNNFSFPSLEEVFVEECPKLKTFSTNTLRTPKLEKVKVEESKWLWDCDLNTTIQYLFIQKWMVQGGWSNDPASQLEATTQFRKLSSERIHQIFDEVMKDEGVVPRLVESLGNQDLPQLQFEAAVWALTNIVASGKPEHRSVVIGHGAVPKLVKLLSSASDDVREQAAWALGYVAGDSPRCRNLVLGLGALVPLLEQLNEHSKLSMLRNATWTLSKLCHGKPPPPFEQVKLALPVLRQLIHLNDEEVLTDACWALSNLSDGPNNKIQAVIEAGVCPRLVELLFQPSPRVLIPALRTVGNIARGDETQIQFVIDIQVLPCLYQLLTQNLEISIKKTACWTISNITAGNTHQIQAVIEANIPLVHLLQHEEFDIKKEAARAVSNATFRGSHEQIQFLVSQGCIMPLCDLLDCPDPRIVTVCLEGLENILKVSEADKEMGLNLYAQMIDECKGRDKLDSLASHDNNEICEKAEELLERYWAE